MAAACPSCGRPAAAARPHCLYCGAPLTGGLTPPTPAEEAESPPPGVADRVLVVLDLRGADPAGLAAALGLPQFEAGQRVRRGGHQLHRIALREDAAEEAARLGAAGLRVRIVPEVEVREAARVVAVRGGRLAEGALRLYAGGSEERVTAADLLLVVKGPVVRERRIERPRRRTLILPRRWDDAERETGLRLHLHRRSRVRPLELDPAAFEFGEHPPVGGPLVQISEWIQALSPTAPVDEEFRRLPPALSPAAPERQEGIASAARALAEGRKPRREEALDNLAQFRFYSGWRACIERGEPGV